MLRFISDLGHRKSGYGQRRRRSALVEANLTVMANSLWCFSQRMGSPVMGRHPSSRFWSPLRLFILSLVVVGVAWGTVFVIASSSDALGLAARGQFGDAFGVVSALFPGLAFVGAATAAYFQRQQLAAQRAEMETMAAAERRNVVDSRFFQLLGSWQTMVNSIGIDMHR